MAWLFIFTKCPNWQSALSYVDDEVGLAIDLYGFKASPTILVGKRRILLGDKRGQKKFAELWCKSIHTTYKYVSNSSPSCFSWHIRSRCCYRSFMFIRKPRFSLWAGVRLYICNSSRYKTWYRVDTLSCLSPNQLQGYQHKRIRRVTREMDVPVPLFYVLALYYK